MRYHNIEFLRFIFSVIIVYFHILHGNIMKYIGSNYDYRILQNLSDNAGWIVECFFIISGYFLYQTIVTEKHKENIMGFMLKKVFRLGPVLWFSIIVSILFFKHSYFAAVFNGLFLQCIGLSLEYKGINWYISPLFWALGFYYCLFRIFEHKYAKYCGGVIVYLCYLVNIEYCHGGFGRETVYGIVNLGVARALAGIGLGCLIAVFLDNIRDFSCSLNKKLQFALISLIEIGSIIFLIKYFLLGLRYQNKFIVVIAFSILFICFICQKGVVSILLNQPVFSVLGKYSYSIYVMQQICFYILQKTLWKTTIINNTFACIAVSLVFSVLVGIVVYHVIEKPSYRWYIKNVKYNKRLAGDGDCY